MCDASDSLGWRLSWRTGPGTRFGEIVRRDQLEALTVREISTVSITIASSTCRDITILARRDVTASSDLRTTNFANQHLDVIARFGRFPHRNAALGRVSSAEELAFLQTPGSGF